MTLNVEELDQLYCKYGYKIVTNLDNVRLYLYEAGRYFGADVVPLNLSEDTRNQCVVLKNQYADGGYAVQIREYQTNQEAERELYRSFFSYETTSKRIKNKYKEFIEGQKKLNGGYKYEYINTPYLINNEPGTSKNIISDINSILVSERPQLIIIEAAAGYGKTCTAYEVLNALLDSEQCENPLFTELSRNRGANIFRYILLDEIDREYSTLDSNLVNYEIQSGKIPLIIDGFDELLHKSDLVKSDKNEIFGEVETMLDTIGNLLQGKAKVILTTRKTAIFAGSEFRNWLTKWNYSFEATRFSIDVPKIKNWLGESRLDFIKNLNIPVEQIANPVLLTYLRNLSEEDFTVHLEDPNTLVRKYFYSLLEREIERQDLRISVEDQYTIFKNVVRMLIEFDQSSEKKAFVREIIIDQNRDILEKAVTLYPGNQSIELIADKLVTHALLDRKGSGDDMIGFINDFVFGTFIGEIMSDSTSSEIEKYFSAYMVEIGATAYRVQNVANKRLLWEKIEALNHKIENNVLFNFDVSLRGELLRSFNETIFQSMTIFKIHFSESFKITASVFINCKFKHCVFDRNVFSSISFIECYFENCQVTDGGFIDNGDNIVTIRCKQKNCSVLPNNYELDEEVIIGSEEYLEENSLLSELYELEVSHKNQRIIHLFKKHKKSDHKKIAKIIERLSEERILSVSGTDVFIEMNKLPDVKRRIGIE